MTVGDANIMIGNFIQAIITFLLTAFVIFSIMKFINALSRKQDPAPVEEAPAVPAEPAEDIKLLMEIRDLLKEAK